MAVLLDKKEDVVARRRAARAKQYSIYSVKRAEQAISLLLAQFHTAL
jgi:hypothetical protein